MDLANKQDLIKFLQERKIYLTKDLGQHYLISRKVLEQIVAAAEIKEGEKVIETGSGVGTLTVELLEKKCELVTAEIDARIFGILQEVLAKYENVEAKNVDALTLEIPTEKYKWVANVPYQITSPLLKKFLDCENTPEISVLLVQKEVAEKICVRDGKNENRLSLLVKNFCTAEMVCPVSAEQFFPAPKVQSAVIKLVKRSAPVLSREAWATAEFLQKVGFAQKRKKLKNNFACVPWGLKVLAEAGVDENLRAENLLLADWEKLVLAYIKITLK